MEEGSDNTVAIFKILIGISLVFPFLPFMIHDFFPYFDKTELGKLHTQLSLSLSLSLYTLLLILSDSACYSLV